MPMPNALVAAITSAWPDMKASCAAMRSSSGSPAWYPTARKPRACRPSATSSVALRVPQYTMAGVPSGADRPDSSIAHLRATAPLPSSRTTSNARFGRSNPVRTVTGSRSARRAVISSDTAGVAVAVRAITARGRSTSRRRAS